MNFDGATCHSAVRTIIPQLQGIKSAFCKKHPHSKWWWDFLVSDHLYQELFTVPGWRLLYDKDKPHMFEVPVGVFKLDVPPALTYAFLIDSRAPFDPPGYGPDRVTTTHKLVSLGVAPRLAYIMSLSLVTKEGEFWFRPDQWTGAHQIFRDHTEYGYPQYTRQTNFSMFLEGKYFKKVIREAYTSALWIPDPMKCGKKPLISETEIQSIGLRKPSGSFGAMNWTIRFEDVDKLVSIFMKNIEQRRKELE